MGYNVDVIKNYLPIIKKNSDLDKAVQALELMEDKKSKETEILTLLKEAKKDLPRAGMLYSEHCINQIIEKISDV